MSLFDATLTNPAELVDHLIGELAQHAPPGYLDVLRGMGDPATLEPHWHTFFAQILAAQDKFSRDHDPALTLTYTFERLQKTLRKRIEDNGISYNLYADAVNKPRPWSLDLFPMILPPSEWQTIAGGVLQRTELLNRILADVYGAQTLIRDGFLPSALVHGHPGYLRQVHGIVPARGQFLHVAAFDLARGADGNWWIMSQRTQAPSGLGYALENRLIVSSLFPQSFSALHVERLANSYKTLLASLASHSPAGSNARIVLLTPGPYSETYFEHVYLARYLGITLVEGGDLVVRDQKLWLKTLQGLEPVDVMMRRLDDDFLDPLELRADSALGIPGLLQAYRAGNVVLANAPGAGFLESSSTLGFLPAISEKLLGEPLKLPSIASWWCGERAILPELFENFSDYVIKPTFNDQPRRFVPALGRSLKEREKQQWIERIANRPEDYSAQAYIPLAHMPTWQGQQASESANRAPIGSQAMMVRVFALSDGNGSWHIMPGGLTRIAPLNRDVVSMYRGGSSADLWVTGATPPQFQQPRITAPPPAIQSHRHAAVISSRAAENLFWLGRYTERLENSVRHARLVLESLSDTEAANTPQALDWLYRVAIHNGLVIKTAPSPQKSPKQFKAALIASLSDKYGELGAYSVACTLSALQQAAFAVRERLAEEQWNLVNSAAMQFDASMREEGASTHTALQALEQLSTHVMAMTGAQIDRMTRDDGWRLLSIGRQVERITTLSDALRLAFTTEAIHDESGFAHLLRLFDSTITYRSRYQQHRNVQSLLELLVLDKENPRSLHWVSDTLAGRIQKLSNGKDLLLLAGQPSDMPHLWSENSLLNMAQQRAYGRIVQLLGTVTDNAERISDLLSQQYFTHVEAENHTVGS